jgi:hypothetical protein
VIRGYGIYSWSPLMVLATHVSCLYSVFACSWYNHVDGKDKNCIFNLISRLMMMIRVLLLLVFMFKGVAAQKVTKKYQQPNKWSIGLHTGLTAPFHDVRRSELGDFGDLSFVMGGTVSHYLSPAFALRGELGYGRVGGSIRNASYLGRFQAIDPAFNGVVDVNTTFLSGYLKGVLNFSGLGLNGVIPDKLERKWNFFGTLGLGAVNYSARVKNVSTGQFIWIPDFGRATGLAMAMPVGTGFSYKVAPRFHIDFEVNLHFVNADNFDGVVIQRASGPASGEPNFGRNLDRFATAQLGFVFHLGNNRQGNTNYWNRSYLQQYYAETSEELSRFENKLLELNRRNQEQDQQITALEEKIAILERQMRFSEAEMKKDSDGDGVPDIYDMEFTKWDLTGMRPSACGWSEVEMQDLREKAGRNEKIKVDGSGVALDVDKDGIPDHLDKCPTIPGISDCHGCKP